VTEPTTAVRAIELDGMRFDYRETGPSDGPPVVLLHALGRDGGDWDPVAAALAAEGHRVLAPDLRGHGGSARPGEYSYELFRDDVGRLMDALGLDRVAVIGHSMGGCVGYLVAEQWPDRVRRLVAVDTPPPFNATVGEPPAEPPRPVPYDWPLARAIVRQLNRQDPAWGGRLGEISVPTLILAGGPTWPRSSRTAGWSPSRAAGTGCSTTGRRSSWPRSSRSSPPTDPLQGCPPRIGA
jgi:pimeloyl-ACP methyl ester carboxylesterase